MARSVAARVLSVLGDVIDLVINQAVSDPRPAPSRDGATPSWSLLDDAQRRGAGAGPSAAANRSRTGRVRRVLGAPGTGKTTVALHRVGQAVTAEGLDVQQCLLIAPSRVRAGVLRERLTRMLGGTTSHVTVRTMESLAFSLVRSRAAGELDTLPQLITGAEQDVILAELMSGHTLGSGRGPAWPEHLREAAGTRALRGELRELLMRVAEEGVDAGQLRDLARRHGVPAWSAAADVLAEYQEVTALASPGAVDAAGLLAQALDCLGDPEAVSRLLGQLRLVVVDDAQELTAAGVRLLRRLGELGVELVLVGDPDAATQAFRGARPEALGSSWDVGGDAGRAAGGAAADGPVAADELVVLRRSYRSGPALGEVASRVSALVGAAGGVAHRRPETVREGGRLEVAVVPSAAAQARHVATLLRRAHLLDGVPWERLAVIVRTGAQAASLRPALAAEGVPVTVPGARVPLREEPAVRPLLTLLRLSLAERPTLDAAGVTDLLVSRVGGSDSLGVRAARRALRRHELTAGGARSSDELLVAAVLGAAAGPTVPTVPRVPRVPAVPAPLARMGAAIAAGRRRAGFRDAAALAPPEPPHEREQAGEPETTQAQHRPGPPRARPQVEVDEVLWAIWSSLGLERTWRSQALRGGPAGARADRDLDAVCALFDAAARYVERLPGSRPEGFLEHVAEQEIAADSLAARRARAGEVTLTTPAGAVGGEWHTVVLAGVQDGVWPDLRPRGSALQIPRLLDALDGRDTEADADRVRRVRHDEARLLYVAVTRATERLVVTAVRDEETRPSAYLDVIDPVDDPDTRRATAPAQRPFSESGVVADLRRRLLTETDERVRAALAERLSRLAEAGVAAADPDRWWAGHEVTDDRPVRPAGEHVSVSPSRVEAFTRCGLRWFLTSCGGQSTHESTAVAVGNLVHEIAAEVDNGDESALHTALEARWARLGLGDGWLVRRQYDLARSMLSRLARYDAQARNDGWQVVGRELPTAVEVGRATVRGRVDRLERDPEGRLRVVDLKTGAGKPTRAEVPRLPQLGAYQVAVNRGAFAAHGADSAGAALLQLGRAAGAQVTLQVQDSLDRDPEPGWAENLLAQVAEGMAADRFEARLSESCRTCPAADSCPLLATRWML